MAYESLRTIGPGESLADAAYNQLSEAILRNELPQGSSLSVTELSEQLGISKGTLWYWLLKYNVSVRRVALGPGESLEIHREN